MRKSYGFRTYPRSRNLPSIIPLASCPKPESTHDFFLRSQICRADPLVRGGPPARLCEPLTGGQGAAATRGVRPTPGTSKRHQHFTSLLRRPLESPAHQTARTRSVSPPRSSRSRPLRSTNGATPRVRRDKAPNDPVAFDHRVPLATGRPHWDLPHRTASRKEEAQSNGLTGDPNQRVRGRTARRFDDPRGGVGSVPSSSATWSSFSNPSASAVPSGPPPLVKMTNR